jgi:hypothetical protein
MSGCCDDKVFEGMSDGYKRALLAVILISCYPRLPLNHSLSKDLKHVAI